MNKILLRTLFIIALIIAIALIALVVIRYSPRFFSYISSASASLFNVFKKDSLEVSVVPQTVISGERVTVSWPVEGQETVSLTYVCNDEYTVSYLGGNSTRIPIRCGDSFELGGTAERAILIPTLTDANSFSDIEITINQERTDDTKAAGIAVITVTSGTAPTSARPTTATSSRPTLTSTSTVPARPTTTRPSTGGPQYVDYPVVTGPANLSLSQPVFINTVNPTVQFVISNNGGKNSGTYNLQASLPNGEIFNSGALAGIPAGGSSLFTLNIGSLVRGTNTVRISIDPNNAVSESNENDNVKEVSFNNGSGSGTSGSGKADLITKVLSIGYIGNSGDIGIRFEIRNVGGRTAEDWRFEAELPNEDEDTFRSDEQPNLKPGEAIEYTLRFNNPEPDGFATIEVDTEDEVDESEEDNNRLRFRVTY